MNAPATTVSLSAEHYNRENDITDLISRLSNLQTREDAIDELHLFTRQALMENPKSARHIFIVAETALTQAAELRAEGLECLLFAD